MSTQLYDIVTNYPFGRGVDGSATLSSDPHTRRTGTGTSGTTALTINSGAYSNGDIILIMDHYTATSTTDNWEVHTISSGGGTTSLTLGENLGQSFSSAQVINVPEYSSLTISSFTGTSWGGSTGGLVAVACSGLITLSGTATLKGGNGSASTSNNTGRSTTGGFWGGNNTTDGGTGKQGEGFSGAGNSSSTSANGSGGGGGGTGGGGKNPGGGGGNGGSGSTSGNGGTGGGTSGNAALTSFHFGGGGGGGRSNSGSESAGGGGSGGGGVILWGKTINISGGINVTGGNGGDGVDGADGAAGAGGSVLMNGMNISLGSNLITATGGTSQVAAGTGRVRVNYGASLTGTSNPTLSSNQDTSLVSFDAGVLFGLT